jgi:hypothetical protein
MAQKAYSPLSRPCGPSRGTEPGLGTLSTVLTKPGKKKKQSWAVCSSTVAWQDSGYVGKEGIAVLENIVLIL